MSRPRKVCATCGRPLARRVYAGAVAEVLRGGARLAWCADHLVDGVSTMAGVGPAHPLAKLADLVAAGGHGTDPEAR